MKLLPLGGFAALLLTALPVLAFDGRTVTDATGRELVIPANPEAVFAAGPPAATLLYTLTPDRMVGWVRAPRGGDLPYLLPEVHALPELGRLTGQGDTLNLEVLLASGADLIVDYGTVNDSYIDLAARVQEQAGLPYVLIDGSFAALPSAIRQMADVLNVSGRGEELAAYAETELAGLDALLATIPEGQRPRVYLARGPEGIETPARGSLNAEIIERVGAINVAEVETRGLATVSPEQVQAWAPEIIITIDRDFAANVANMPEWQGVPAVANGRVYLAPSAPFGFIDSPPSVNRLAGIIWLQHIFYPEAAKGELNADIAGFYSLFYGVDLDEAAVNGLLGE